MEYRVSVEGGGDGWVGGGSGDGGGGVNPSSSNPRRVTGTDPVPFEADAAGLRRRPGPPMPTRRSRAGTLYCDGALIPSVETWEPSGRGVSWQLGNDRPTSQGRGPGGRDAAGPEKIGMSQGRGPGGLGRSARLLLLDPLQEGLGPAPGRSDVRGGGRRSRTREEHLDSELELLSATPAPEPALRACAALVALRPS